MSGLAGKIYVMAALLMTAGSLSAQMVSKAAISSVILIDSTGTRQKANFFTENKPVAIIFLSPECPLCRNYTATLNKLNGKYGDRVLFAGIVPGSSYSAEDVNTFRKDFAVGFPVYIDPGKKLAEELQATITPEVFLLAPDGPLLYSGKIDNWAVKLGQTRQVITERYLEDAIGNYLSGMPVVVKRTRAVGCMINMF